ncbi:helix-turn-helix transcriptional regulator [Flavobacterium sp. Sd200]|uniref:helix-turn-helix transcriptional regulator n=1 Tax=Flavobacterium sp. Sd200 TaxID=2692211 RepID=UPI00136FD199|nr:helix-turn-helix transcriptional regulator [Flavobacterium sp. Sd200]
MPANKYIFTIVLMLLGISFLVAQTPQQKADSAETVLVGIPARDTAHLLATANFILENSSNSRQRFEILERISVGYFHVNDINKSIAYAFKAKDAAEEFGDAETLAQAYGSIANLYFQLDLTDKARPYLATAIKHIENMPSGDNKYKLKALSFLEMGNLDFNAKDYKRANDNYKKALSQFGSIKSVKNKSTYHYRRALYNIGNSYHFLQQADSAETYLNHALLLKDPKNPELKFYIETTLAEVYRGRREYKRAVDTLQSVLKARDFDAEPLKIEIYLNLSRNYKALGDAANYALYNEKHLALRDTLQSREREAINTAIDVEKKSLSESVQRSDQKNTWLTIAILGILFISGGIIVYLNRAKKKERALYLNLIERLQSQSSFALPQPEESEQEIETDIQTAYTIPPAVEAEILEGLQNFEEDEGYRNPALTVSMLAVSLKTNPAYLSAVIKAHKDNNFNAYINELRIKYICRKIHEQREYANYKISYLAEDCGFTSHSAFSTVFKKVTGISPSVFLREEEKLNMTG